MQCFLALVFVFAALVGHAGIVEEVVVLSKQEIAQRRETLPWIATDRSDGQLTFKLSLREAWGVEGKFDEYALRVLDRAVSADSLRVDYFNAKHLRSESRRAKSATFILPEEDAARAYLVITAWQPRDKNGMGRRRHECILVSDLLATQKPRDLAPSRKSVAL
jgi:hypothetical protein